MFKKWFSILLACIMTLTSIPVGAFSETVYIVPKQSEVPAQAESLQTGINLIPENAEADTVSTDAADTPEDSIV